MLPHSMRNSALRGIVLGLDAGITNDSDYQRIHRIKRIKRIENTLREYRTPQRVTIRTSVYPVDSSVKQFAN